LSGSLACPGVPVRASPQLCAENCSCGGGRRGAGNRNPEGMVLSLVARPARRRPWIPIPILPPPAPDDGHGQPTEPPVLPPSINGQQRPACCLLCFHSSLFKPHQDRDCCCCRNRNRTDTDTERRLSISPLLASAWTLLPAQHSGNHRHFAHAKSELQSSDGLAVT